MIARKKQKTRHQKSKIQEKIESIQKTFGRERDFSGWWPRGPLSLLKKMSRGGIPSAESFLVPWGTPSSKSFPRSHAPSVGLQRWLPTLAPSVGALGSIGPRWPNTISRWPKTSPGMHYVTCRDNDPDPWNLTRHAQRHLGAILEPSWPNLGDHGAVLAPSWAMLERSRPILGLFWLIVEPS